MCSIHINFDKKAILKELIYSYMVLLKNWKSSLDKKVDIRLWLMIRGIKKKDQDIILTLFLFVYSRKIIQFFCILKAYHSLSIRSTVKGSVSSNAYVLSLLYPGLDDDEVETELDDIKLLRIARLLHPDKLMELSANLVGNVQFLSKLERTYRGFDASDHAFMILHEWKKLINNARQTPTAGKLIAVFDDIHIDKHQLCQV